MSTHRGIGAVCYTQEDMADQERNWKVSLRSTGDEDTEAISRVYGGGGHKNASSFSLPKVTFETWRKTS